MPQEELLSYLKGLPSHGIGAPDEIGVGLDACVIPLRHKGLYLVQTTDFFFPLIEDPYTMGKIACANVLSDLYAMGVVDIDNVLMLLGVSTDMTLAERTLVTPHVIKGFNDLCAAAGTRVTSARVLPSLWCGDLFSARAC